MEIGDKYAPKSKKRNWDNYVAKQNIKGNGMAYLEAIAKTTALPLTSELWSDQHRNRAKPKNGNSVQQLFNPIFNELTIIGTAKRNRLDRGQSARHTKGVSSQLHNGLLLWPSLLCYVRGLINCLAWWIVQQNSRMWYTNYNRANSYHKPWPWSQQLDLEARLINGCSTGKGSSTTINGRGGGTANEIRKLR